MSMNQSDYPYVWCSTLIHTDRRGQRCVVLPGLSGVAVDGQCQVRFEEDGFTTGAVPRQSVRRIGPKLALTLTISLDGERSRGAGRGLPRAERHKGK